jgi:hypothetical protein
MLFHGDIFWIFVNKNQRRASIYIKEEDFKKLVRLPAKEPDNGFARFKYNRKQGEKRN